MIIRYEISDDEEIVIRVPSVGQREEDIRKAIEAALNDKDEMLLCGDDGECFVKKRDILFFESFDSKVYAHTKDRVFRAPYKLFELEGILSPCFARISKSTVANVSLISRIKRELVGNGEIGFYNSEKTAYFSRAYYKILDQKIKEMRNVK
jgi:DNA-binding LytR/AlgR family response regulator